MPDLLPGLESTPVHLPASPFDLPELLLIIVDFLKDKISDVYHLGLTNTYIWGVVETIIWRNSANAQALRGLLPADVVTTFGLPSRTIEGHEWSRLLYYGRYIDHLELIERPIKGDYVQDLLVLLQGHQDPLRLMPNLRSLHMVLGQRHSLAAAPVILQWPLSRLCLHVDIRKHLEPATLKSILSSIRPGPHLEVLHVLLEGRVLVDVWSNLLDPIFAALLPQLLRLRILNLKTVTGGVILFPRLAPLPLESLEIVITSDLNPLSAYDLPPPAFRALRSLKIDSEESYYQPQILFLFQSITSTKLEELHFYCEHAHVLQDVSRLVSSRWSETMSSLRISMSIMEDSIAAFPHSFFDAMQPLLTCRNMRQFWLISDVFIPWDDDRVQAMITAWPSLEAFWIDDGWAASQRITPLVTRSTLISFSRGCPQLTHLRLSINYELPPINIVWQGNPRSKLRHLNADYSVCFNPVAAADFLRQTFPLLEGMTAAGSGMVPVVELLHVNKEADEPARYELTVAVADEPAHRLHSGSIAR